MLFRYSIDNPILFRYYPDTVPILFRYCFDTIPIIVQMFWPMFRRCSVNDVLQFLSILQVCSGDVLVMLRECFGSAPVLLMQGCSGGCFGDVQVMFRPCSIDVRVMFRGCSSSVPILLMR